jgi:hypothetical protein
MEIGCCDDFVSGKGLRSIGKVPNVPKLTNAEPQLAAYESFRGIRLLMNSLLPTQIEIIAGRY